MTPHIKLNINHQSFPKSHSLHSQASGNARVSRRALWERGTRLALKGRVGCG